jgi:hypothetical protein
MSLFLLISRENIPTAEFGMISAETASWEGVWDIERK